MKKKKPIKQTMKHKGWVGLLMTLQALPVPVTLFSVPFSMISMANINAMKETSTFYAAFFVLTMVLFGAYTLTYALSIFLTVKRKKLCIFTFLPLIHLFVAILCIAIGLRWEQTYYV